MDKVKQKVKELKKTRVSLLNEIELMNQKIAQIKKIAETKIAEIEKEGGEKMREVIKLEGAIRELENLDKMEDKE